MRHFSILTVNHDRLHEDLRDPNLGDKLTATIFGNTRYGVPGKEYRNQLMQYRDGTKSFDLAYMANTDTCQVLAFSHGYIKGEVGSIQIPRRDNKTLDDYLVAVAKAFLSQWLPVYERMLKIDIQAHKEVDLVMALYHTDIFIPADLKLPSGVMLLEYGSHALREALSDR